MTLTIKNAEAERLARELAHRRGRSIVETLTELLRREVELERSKSADRFDRAAQGPEQDDPEQRLRRIQNVVQEIKQLPVLDHRCPDEILGYNNEQGRFGGGWSASPQGVTPSPASGRGLG